MMKAITRRTLALLALVGFMSLAPASGLRADDAADALKAIQGTWATDNDEAKWSFENDKVKTSVGGNDYVSKAIVIDAKAKPAKIDFEVKEGDQAGATAYGIYKLEGEDLTICINVPGITTRPTEFTAKEGETYVFKLKKKK